MKRRLIFLVIVESCFVANVNARVLLKDSLNYVQQATLSVIPNALNFIVMGDWGRKVDGFKNIRQKI